MNRDKKTIKRLLSNKDYRFTKQREKIYDIFLKNKKHFTTKELQDSLQKYNISISTIYRTLELFLEIGVIKKTKIKDEYYYELKHNNCNKKEFHIHINCNNCNKILHLNNDKIKKNIDSVYFDIQKKHNFILRDMSLVFKCSCKQCSGYEGN